VVLKPSVPSADHGQTLVVADDGGGGLDPHVPGRQAGVCGEAAVEVSLIGPGETWQATHNL
jgi:hypothetical protein